CACEGPSGDVCPRTPDDLPGPGDGQGPLRPAGPEPPGPGPLPAPRRSGVAVCGRAAPAVATVVQPAPCGPVGEPHPGRDLRDPRARRPTSSAPRFERHRPTADAVVTTTGLGQIIT